MKNQSQGHPTFNSHAEVELFYDGLGKLTLSSGDSITTIEPLESDDVSGDENEVRQVQSIHAREQGGVSLVNRTMADRGQHGTFLSWRSDPIASMSDWKIKVLEIDDNRPARSTLYHCHSNVLVWGPRKCKLFIELFQQRIKVMPPPSSTVLELTASEAKVFPMLLDFLYCATTFTLSADSICSLYGLARRFESEMLETAIQTFLETSLDFEQSVDFLSCARRHPDREKLEKLILFTNSRICGYLAKNPKEASKVPATVLAQILNKRAQVLKVLKGENPRKFSGEWELGRSRQLSSVVANCCLHSSRSRNEMTADDEKLSKQTFELLTDPMHLPALNCEAALSLLKVDFILGVQEEGKQGSAPATSRPTLNSFEYRCVDAIVAEWTNILAREPHAQLLTILSDTKSHVLVEILIKVSRQYEQRMANLGTARGHDILQDMRSNNSPEQKKPPGLSDNKALKVDTTRSTRRASTEVVWESRADSCIRDDDSDSLTYSTDRYGVASER
jgi:hypothetical protein